MVEACNIIIQGTEITHFNLLVLFAKSHVAPKVTRMVWRNSNGAERQPPWTILNIVSSYDSYESKQLKLYVSSHAKIYIYYNLRPTPLVENTSDTWKWFRILYRELRSIVLRLGFHTILSFLESIGHIMTGSGLEDANLCQRCSQCCLGKLMRTLFSWSFS